MANADVISKFTKEKAVSASAERNIGEVKAINLDSSKIFMISTKAVDNFDQAMSKNDPITYGKLGFIYTPDSSMSLDIKKITRSYGRVFSFEYGQVGGEDLIAVMTNAAETTVLGTARMDPGQTELVFDYDLMEEVRTNGARVKIATCITGRPTSDANTRIQRISPPIDITNTIRGLIPEKEEEYNVTMTNLQSASGPVSDFEMFALKGDDIIKYGCFQRNDSIWKPETFSIRAKYYANADGVNSSGFKYEPLGFNPYALNQDVKLTALYGQNSAKFIGLDGNVYEQVVFTNGGTFTPPSPPAPAKQGEQFKEWEYDPPIADMTVVTEDVFAIPKYEKIPDATVQYKDDLGNLLHEEVVLIGEGAKEIPTPPVKAGFRFTGWTLDPVGSDLTNITENIVAAATYIQEFTYTYYSDDAGTYEVVFGTENGTKVTVKATVSDEVYVDKSALQATEGTYEIPLSTSEYTTGKVYAQVKQEAPSIDGSLTPTQPPTIIKKEITRVKKEQSGIPKQQTPLLSKEETNVTTKPGGVKLETVKPTSQGTILTNSDDKMQWVVWTIIVSYGCYMAVRVFVKKPKEE